MVDDPNVIIYGNETIFRNDQHVGWLTSGGFGHTVGKPLGMGYIHFRDGANAETLAAGKYELEVRTRRASASIQLRPVYDPKNIRPMS